MNVLDRFMQYVKVVDSGCHEWQSTIKRDGYGQFWLDKPTLAHRVSFMIFSGAIPKGKCVLHKCDNRKCVNPDHLYVGTHKDNVRDMHERGRFVGHRTLTQEQVSEIKQLYAAGGISQQKLAEKFGVKQSAISKIVLNRTWKGK